MEIKCIMDIIFVISVVFECYQRFIREVSRRRIWVRDLYLQREISGFFSTTYNLIKECDPEQFKIATRMTKETYELLLNLLRDKLTKNSIRKPISPECRLFLTLLYLAHGGSKPYISLTFKMALSTVRSIVKETCEIIWDELSSIYIALPNQHEWGKIAEDFKNIWNLPNCVGAIDGKHINITCPPNSNSMYFNYKKTFSIVLLGVCDANYTFTAVDIGAYGSQSDGGVLNFSEFGKRLFQGRLNLPDASNLPESDKEFPHYFVGDAAFPLKKYLMKPFPGLLLSEKKENYNRRISRARRTIENTFGILTARWRILRTTLNMFPETAEIIVKATVVLHNFLKMTDNTYCPTEYTDKYIGNTVVEGLWRKEIRPLNKAKHFGSNNASRTAFQLRNELCEYLFTHRLYNNQATN